MPFFLIIFGALLLVSAIKGNHRDLFKLLKEDFSGDGNFIYWSLAVGAIVMIGTIKSIRPISDAFLTLVILIIVVSNYRRMNLFESFLKQVREGTGGVYEASIGTYAKQEAGKWVNNFQLKDLMP